MTTTPTTPAARKELYRTDNGHEVWRIVRADGTLAAEDVASDRDAAWLLEREQAAQTG